MLNPEKSGVYLIQSWVDGGQKSDRSPFIVTPPLFRINPGEENILRIVRTGGFLPENRESVFWLNVKSIPAMDSRAPDENRLQLVVKSRLKLFYRPSGLKGDP
ncbi:TPA: molecular chaperone, partial [Salmonella enterica subsp. enterica serovar Oranienburg]